MHPVLRGSEEVSIPVTITVGSNLGINTSDISAGLYSNVSRSTTTATTDTESADCPAGGWTCGLAITPSVYQTTGYVTWEVATGCDIPSNYQDGDYTVQYPIVDGEGKAVITASVCACSDKAGWDDAQAPPKCPSNCGGTD